MKYILAVKNGWKDIEGMIFKFYKYDESLGYDPNAIAVKALSDISTDTKKGNTLYFLNVAELKWKDATPVYDKINKLLDYIGKHSPQEMRIKTNTGLKMFRATREIKKNFENGIYPTKTEFRWMNTIWNKLK